MRLRSLRWRRCPGFRNAPETHAVYPVPEPLYEATGRERTAERTIEHLRWTEYEVRCNVCCWVFWTPFRVEELSADTAP